jgi:hypothetical protein
MAMKGTVVAQGNGKLVITSLLVLILAIISQLYHSGVRSFQREDEAQKLGNMAILNATSKKS